MIKLNALVGTIRRSFAFIILLLFENLKKAFFFFFFLICQIKSY
jgi:hypothetical protein